MLLDLTEAIKHQGDSISFVAQGILPEGALPDDVELDGEVSVTGSLTAFGHSVAVCGTIHASFKVSCALCLKPMVYKLSVNYDELLQRRGYEHEKLDEDDEEDISEQDPVMFDGSSCDITDSVCEAINLHLPMRYLCKSDCKGLCPSCGKDLNKGSCTCTPAGSSPFAALKQLLEEEKE